MGSLGSSAEKKKIQIRHWVNAFSYKDITGDLGTTPGTAFCFKPSAHNRALPQASKESSSKIQTPGRTVGFDF